VNLKWLNLSANAKIVLKVGCPIIMMRNYSPKNGIVNGTRLIITEILTQSVKARILSGMEAHWGKEVLIGKVAITPMTQSTLVPLYDDTSSLSALHLR